MVSGLCPQWSDRGGLGLLVEGQKQEDVQKEQEKRQPVREVILALECRDPELCTLPELRDPLCGWLFLESFRLFLLSVP